MPRVEWILLYLVLGAFVGFMAGLLGVGGGGILVPLLTSIFAYQGISADNVVHLALGTSLTCMIVSSTVIFRMHASRGAVVWQAVGGKAPRIILGAFLAAQFAANISSTYIAIFFALFMALVAGQMFLNWQPKPRWNEIHRRMQVDGRKSKVNNPTESRIAYLLRPPRTGKFSQLRFR